MSDKAPSVGPYLSLEEMYLTRDKTLEAFRASARVLADTRLFGGDSSLIPISIDQFMDCVAEIYPNRIIKRGVNFDATNLRGRIERDVTGDARIDVRQGQLLYWRRLTAVKEHMHLLIDDEDDYSPYGDETLDTLVQEGVIGMLVADGDPFTACQTELIAEIAAMEVLWPINLRLKEVNAARETSSTEFVKDISDKYRIPAPVVENMLSRSYTKLALEVSQSEQNG
jgi:hypothetical protein